MAQQVLSPPVISPFSSLTSTTGSVDVRQLQVLEKLQQLRQWQQQQQEHLLKQQQYELSSLKNEQDAIRKRLGLIKDTENTNESLKRHQLTPPSAQPVTSAQDTSNEYVVSSETSPQSDIIPSIKQDTPFYGSLQPEGHTISGSSLKSTHSADSGMLSGQTSAVDVLRRPSQSSEEQLNHSSGFQTPESNILTDSEPEETHYDQNNKDVNVDTRDHCPLVPSSDNLPHDDIPVRPGVGPGSASTFEELLEKKLQLYENTTHVLPPEPTLVRCPSEDSFLVRKEQRKKEEEAELAEFEMLERAAQESSFSSQCSIVMRALGNSELSSSPKSLHPINKSLSRNRDGRSLSLSPVDKRSVTPQPLATDNTKLTEPQNTNSTPSLPIDLKIPLQNEICTSLNSRKSMITSDHGIIPATTALLPAVQEDDEDSDLDSTLRSKHGYQFGDEEEWDSFNTETPKQTKPLSCVTKKSPITSPGQYVGQNGATVNDTSAKNGNIVNGGPGRVRKVCILPPANKMELVNSSDSDSTDAENSDIEYPIIQSQSQHVPKSTAPHLTSVQPTSIPSTAYPSSNTASSSISSSTYLAALPPPSTLVAKLFPSLKKERDTAKAKMLEKVSANAQQTNSTKRTPPPASTPPTLSLPNGLDVQVKEKLAQLEKEIERFKTENTALEKLHIEKEQGLLYMKKQIADFEHEKQQEIANFEKYKQEEIKKLKKERRVFETYQREARSLRDKKDKEEIVALKQELEEVKEELRQKESRWSSTLSRYRLRIDNLEAQNEELQNDLKMMEEQRLLQWQQQLDSKKATGQHKQKMFLNTSLSPVKTDMLELEPDELTEDEICELLDQPQVKQAKIQNYKPPQQTKSTIFKTKQRRKSDPPHKAPFINESKVPPTIKKPKIDKENKKPKPLHNSSPTHFKTQPNHKPIQTTMKQPMKKTVNKPTLSNASSTTKKPFLKHSENIIINKSEEAPQHVLQRKDHCSSDVERSQPLVVRKEIEGVESESDCSIIEVRAVDMVTEGRDEVTSDSDLSEKADAIINQILGPEEQENDVAKRSTIKEDFCHTRDNVTTSQSKTVRFDISSSTSPVDNLPTDLVSVHEQTKAPQINTISNTINITKETQEEDGSKVVLFSNGTRKVLSADGQTSTVYFFNGDIKRTQSDDTIVYYYSSSRTTHTTQSDGTEILEFSNGQSEKHHPNGCKEIHFPDGTIRHMLLDGKEKIVFCDGTVQQVQPNGNRTIDFPDGQREVHTKQYKRREYPDGTVKTVYPDGHQETKYANGRLRVKDKDGQVIVDRMDTPPTYMST